jgi:hypothetical protein
VRIPLVSAWEGEDAIDATGFVICPRGSHRAKVEEIVVGYE